MATYKKPFEVEEKDLARLSADDFTKLMKRLLTAEVHKAGIPKSAVEGTLQINVSDGGEDIRVDRGARSDRLYPGQVHRVPVQGREPE